MGPEISSGGEPVEKPLDPCSHLFQIPWTHSENQLYNKRSGGSSPAAPKGNEKPAPSWLLCMRTVSIWRQYEKNSIYTDYFTVSRFLLTKRFFIGAQLTLSFIFADKFPSNCPLVNQPQKCDNILMLLLILLGKPRRVRGAADSFCCVADCAGNNPYVLLIL